MIKKFRTLWKFRYLILSLLIILTAYWFIVGGYFLSEIGLRGSYPCNSMNQDIFPGALPLLRQDGYEQWVGTFIDFSVNEDMTIRSMDFEVIGLSGYGERLNFNWYIGEDSGLTDLEHRVLVKKSFVPAWKLGSQSVDFDVPFEAKKNVKYTLHVNNVRQDTYCSNILFVDSNVVNESSYSLLREHSHYMYTQSKEMKLTFKS